MSTKGRKTRNPNVGGSRLIDNHAQREEIVHDIVEQQLSIRGIAEKWGIDRGAVERFRRSMGSRLVKVAEVQFQNTATDIVNELGTIVVACRKMLRACDLELSDPNNPNEYDLSPRAGEVDIIYDLVGPRGGRVRKKEKLQDLLNEVRGVKKGLHVGAVNAADPRELILKTSIAFNKQLELAMKISENVRDSQRELITDSDIMHLSRIVLEELSGHPELRQRIAQRIRSEVTKLDTQS